MLHFGRIVALELATSGTITGELVTRLCQQQTVLCGVIMARTILIVEDEKPLRDTLEFVLLTEGHTVLTAVHGADALRILEHVVPDIILLDSTMPVMDGKEFSRRYRERDGVKAPIILCSANGSTAAAEEISAVDYLHKPFGVRDLLAALDRVSNRRQRPTASSARAEGSTTWSRDPEAAANSDDVSARKPDAALRPISSAMIECRSCRKSVPSHLAYSLRGHSGYRCKSCHDLLMDGIARGRSRPLLRDRRASRT
jgi:CheY-like chemotaxis protein